MVTSEVYFKTKVGLLVKSYIEPSHRTFQNFTNVHVRER